MPATSSNKLQGYLAKLYLTPSGGTEVSIANLTKVDVTVTAKEIDTSDHDTLGWEDTISGLAKWSGTAGFLYVTNSASRQALFNALVNKTPVALSFRPTDVTSEEAWTGNAVITSFKVAAGNSDAQAVDIAFSGKGPLTPGTVAVAGA